MKAMPHWPPEEDVHYPPIPPSEIGTLVDLDLELTLDRMDPMRPEDRWAASYVFDMVERPSQTKVGQISLRLADTEELLFYGGHVGYGVEEPFRGRHYAARSVKLLLPLAKRIGMKTLWITCDPANIASRRTCEIAGGELVEILEIPSTSPMYGQGRRESCRYRFDLEGSQPGAL